MTQGVVVRAGSPASDRLARTTATTQRWCINGTIAIQIPQAATFDWARWQSTVAPLPPETPAERQDREHLERQRQRAAERAATERAAQAASARAKELLLANLTDEQRAEYEQHQRFRVTSSAGQCFEIEHGEFHNVYLLDDAGQRVTRYCGYFPGVPLADNILAQKLLIETDEARYLAGSNASRMR